MPATKKPRAGVLSRPQYARESLNAAVDLVDGAIGPPSPGGDDAAQILREDGGYLLREDGAKFLRE